MLFLFFFASIPFLRKLRPHSICTYKCSVSCTFIYAKCVSCDPNSDLDFVQNSSPPVLSSLIFCGIVKAPNNDRNRSYVTHINSTKQERIHIRWHRLTNLIYLGTNALATLNRIHFSQNKCIWISYWMVSNEVDFLTIG